MDPFILYTYQSQFHGTAPNEPAPTEVCHAYLFLTQADADAAAPVAKKALVDDFTVPGSFGTMVLPLETMPA